MPEEKTVWQSLLEILQDPRVAEPAGALFTDLQSGPAAVLTVLARFDRVDRKLDHINRVQHALVRLVKESLESSPDPGQIHALKEEITQLEAAAGHLTDAMASTPS